MRRPGRGPAGRGRARAFGSRKAERPTKAARRTLFEASQKKAPAPSTAWSVTCDRCDRGRGRRRVGPLESSSTLANRATSRSHSERQPNRERKKRRAVTVGGERSPRSAVFHVRAPCRPQAADIRSREGSFTLQRRNPAMQFRTSTRRGPASDGERRTRSLRSTSAERERAWTADLVPRHASAPARRSASSSSSNALHPPGVRDSIDTLRSAGQTCSRSAALRLRGIWGVRSICRSQAVRNRVHNHPQGTSRARASRR